MLGPIIDDLGGVAAAARAAGVHVATVRRWLRGATPIPTAAYRCLLAATSWGRRERAAFSEDERRLLLALVEALQAENRALREQLRRVARLASPGAANGPAYVIPGA